MDTKTFGEEKHVDATKASRLPAGSTLKVGDVHVPHPHADANLPGAGDPRLGDTKAVTEEFVLDHENGQGNLQSRPLDEIVRPKVVSVADAGKHADPTDKQVIVEQPNLSKTATTPETEQHQ